MIVFGGRGGRGNEGIAQTDGIGTGAAINGGGVSGYGRLDTTEEVVMTIVRRVGRRRGGGPIVNLIPRTGSNTFTHRFQGSGLTGSMQGSNYTQELRDAGLRSPAKTNYQWDASLMHGGPDRAEIGCGSSTRRGTREAAPMSRAIFFNKNAGDSTKWTYDPDLSRPARNSTSGYDHADAASDDAGDAQDAGGRLRGRRARSGSATTPQIGVVGAAALATPETGTVGGTGAPRCSRSKGHWTITSRAPARRQLRLVPPELERARAARTTIEI